ncbi:transcription factor Jra [Chironomus tepperi]|uniref:transcription factor Jra n=1 Tax=Chironomus tepperi TaxID=113505 RepID=UPI00391F9141
MRSYNNNPNNSNNKDNKPNEQKSSEPIMKRPLTLDLNKKINSNALLLSTPDVEKMIIKSPELENFILDTHTLQTPSSMQTPSQDVFQPSKITTEQEDYAKGFEDALNKLKTRETGNQVKSAIQNAPSMSGGGINYSESDNSNMLLQQIKEEPEPASPAHQNINPIDMESQEKIKLERKRQRNRVAASKCRKRKLERISKLEDRVKILKVENGELGSVLLNLKQHVFDLKKQVIDHHDSGCHISIKN